MEHGTLSVKISARFSYLLHHCSSKEKNPLLVVLFVNSIMVIHNARSVIVMQYIFSISNPDVNGNLSGGPYTYNEMELMRC